MPKGFQLLQRQANVTDGEMKRLLHTRTPLKGIRASAEGIGCRDDSAAANTQDRVYKRVDGAAPEQKHEHRTVRGWHAALGAAVWGEGRTEQGAEQAKQNALSHLNVALDTYHASLADRVDAELANLEEVDPEGQDGESRNTADPWLDDELMAVVKGAE